MTLQVVPMVAGIGTQEIVLILIVLVLLFGAKKLPELARGSGRALRIFKAETKGLLEDEDDPDQKTEEQRQLEAQRSAEAADRIEDAEVEEQRRPDAER
jgi:sec-independent protein translocase protein TatA